MNDAEPRCLVGSVCTDITHSCSQPGHTTLPAECAFTSNLCDFITLTAKGGQRLSSSSLTNTATPLLAPTYSLHTHILSDAPEDSDVFEVLTRQPLIPEYIFTCNYTFKANPEASLQVVEAKACGKECEDYVAKLPSFQAFRKAGCPDMAGAP